MAPSTPQKRLWRDRIASAIILRPLINAYRHAQELCNASLPGNCHRGKGTGHGMAPACAAPQLAKEAASTIQAAAASVAAEYEAEMNRRWQRHRNPDRRVDLITADIIDIGMLFAKVFGRHHAENYFRCTVVEPHVYRRILLGQARGRPGPGDAGELVPLN